MLPELGKKVATIGSAIDNDVRLVGNGIAPNHARILNEDGKLWFESTLPGATRNNQPLAANTRTEFDFASDFRIGDSIVPLTHPAIVQMLMSPGALQSQPGV